MRYLLPDDIARETAELARRPGCRVTPLGDEPLRRWLQVLQLGTGRVHVAVKGNAHADEPAGPVTCLRFARWLLDDPAGQALAADVTFHLLPTANPAGLLRNRGWLVGPEGDLERWFEHVDRDPPAADREFGYGDTPAQAAHPECAAWHGYLDALPRVDGYVSLHSMAFAGGAWFLTQLDDLARRQPLLTALARVAADPGPKMARKTTRSAWA